MRVVVIPEDFRKDQYILEPLIRAMVGHLGKATAKVAVCRDPLLGGVDAALEWKRIAEIIDRYPMADLFLLIVDRDGIATRRAALDRIEDQARERLSAGKLLLGECAWQELEVWVLAGHDLPREWVWADVRQEAHSKERFFEPFAQSRGVADGPAGGRKTLAREAAGRYGRIRQLCPEDVAVLEARTRTFIESP